MIKNNASDSLTIATAAACSNTVCTKQNAAVSSRNPFTDRTNKENSPPTIEETCPSAPTVSSSTTTAMVPKSRVNNGCVAQNCNKKGEEKDGLDESLINMKTSQQMMQLYSRGNKKLLLQTIESLEQKLLTLQTQLASSPPSSSAHTSLTTHASHITSTLATLTTFLSTLPPPPDIDSVDHSDSQSLVDYLVPIYAYLLEKEQQSLLPRRYLSSTQLDITEKMRSILVDWIVEVHRMFKLLPETLFLTVYIIDRCLSVERVERGKLQLVGITAMLVAAKYEEIYAPECSDFVYVSDGAYTKRQILEMEGVILGALEWKLTTPLALQFLRRYSKVANSDYNVHSLCKYIIEVALLDADIHSYPPSIIAAASVYIARKMTAETALWNPTLEHYTEYSETEVVEASHYVNAILKATKTSTTLKAIEKKYSMVKFGQVTNIPLVDL